MGLLSSAGQLIDAYSHRFFRKIPITLSLMKPRYRYKYIYELYPYRLYNLYNHRFLIENGFKMYNKTLDTMSKVLKKYYYLKYNKYSYCNYFYSKLFEDLDRQITLIFSKLEKFDKPFSL